MSRPTLAERFWKSAPKGEPDQCWLWTGPLNRLGYGTIGRGGGKHDRVHRVSYELSVGSIPEGMHILHSCDVRHCVNPAHLRIGTHAENMRERSERNRVNAAKGERCAKSKLTESQVREIRARLAAGESGASIGRAFGVGKDTISCIKRGVTWGHMRPEHLRGAVNL